MKNLLLLTSLIFGTISTLQAQEQGDSRLHVLGQYGMRMEEPGIGVGWEYFFAPQFGLVPSFTQIFPAIGRASNFSADLRYYLSQGKSQVYVVSGYSLTTENPQPTTAGTRRNLNGANVGVGAVVPINSWVGISSEFKFQSQGIQQTYFRFGLQFPIGK
ncbi:MAG: hypothetical protein O2829_01205 [Bacteroidetes bacterium]|nr:hypothetical protein [Bacteroidota bacterium]MDA1267698.1 hypothetical protein [Bacteroidota bacterium]